MSMKLRDWLPSVILFFVGFIFHEQIFAFFGMHG